MSELAAALAPLLEATDSKQRYVVVDGLHVTVFPSGVVNIDRREGDLERADVDAMRAAFTELGYDELEAWLPVQGMTLLSSGVSAGASFRIQKRA